jgi:redox-regulated HSP33 family molecular chaperone
MQRKVERQGRRREMQKKKVYDALLPMVGEEKITDVAWKVFELMEELIIETEVKVLDEFMPADGCTAKQSNRVREIMRQAIKDVDEGRRYPSSASVKCQTCGAWVKTNDDRHPCFITLGEV